VQSPELNPQYLTYTEKKNDITVLSFSNRTMGLKILDVFGNHKYKKTILFFKPIWVLSLYVHCSKLKLLRAKILFQNKYKNEISDIKILDL
jgi:hypothetical protein